MTDSKTDAGGVDKLSERKLSCREVARYIWDRAQNSPACFEQDIARLIKNERKMAVERSTPLARSDAENVPVADWELVAWDWQKRAFDAEAKLAALASPPPSGVREALSRDNLLIDPHIIGAAMSAAKQIARAERLDNVSAKEAYRTIIEAVISACLALSQLPATDEAGGKQ